MKNKYLEAFNYFFTPRLVAVPRNQGKQDEFGRNKDLLQELVDKATPMKIKEEWVGGEDDDYVKYLCPKCHIDLYMNEKYCDNCGQKLDWSDV